MGRSSPKKTAIFKCKHCPREYKKQKNFENHMKCHKMPKIVKCAKCDSLFSSASELKDHISKEHLKLEILDCNECGESFADEASLKSHFCKHAAQTLFKCDECQRSFKYLRTLKSHQRVHCGLKKDLHTCRSCPKMFASDADLKKHEKFHSDIELNFSTSVGESPNQSKNSKTVKQSARKSMRATRKYWCHLCNCGFAEIEIFKMHIITRHQRAKSAESDTDYKKSEKSNLLSRKPVVKNSPTKYKTIKLRNRKRFKNSQQQFITYTPKGQQSIESVKNEATVEYSQKQPVFFDGNQATERFPQSYQAGEFYNLVQPVQQPSNSLISIGNVPNMQFISVPPVQNIQQNDLESVPKFDFYSEKYIRWLKKFINKCESQKLPFSPAVVKQIRKVNSDLFEALLDSASLKSREDHFYLLKFYKLIANITFNHVKYHLSSKTGK